MSKEQKSEASGRPVLAAGGITAVGYGMGQVLTKKFELLRKSYTFFMYGLTVSVAAYIVIFILTTFAPTTVGI